MTNDLVEHVKERVTCRMFVEHIGLAINRAGYCRCPFHGERTASLKIYDSTDSWYCFGCHAGGDLINMARRYYNLPFVDAVKQLAAEFGVEDAEISPAEALKRAVKRAEVKSLRERRERIRERLDAEYWTYYEKWLDTEEDIARYAPKTREEDFDTRFVRAIVARDVLLHRMEDADIRRKNPDDCE